MQLKQLIQQISTLSVEGSLDREVAGITYDSRRVTPGMIFVAIPGQNHDGHHYINVAIDRGAAAIICERNGFSSHRSAKIKVADSREVLAQLSSVFYQNPASKLKMIGVTGTNGKTTIAFLVKQMLEAGGIKTGLISTVRYEIGDRMIPAHRTTPESLEIQQMLSQMLRADCQACVMEVSSHALDQKRVAGIQFDVGIFTNLTQDHLDYHGTMEAYYEAKKKLFSGIEEGSRGGRTIINIDDSFGARLSREVRPEIQLTYGIDQAATVRATQIHLGATETTMVVETADKNFSCHLPLIGRHNVYNALAAVGAGLSLKLDPLVIKNALATMQPVPGRLERVACGQPFGVFVDYAHTDDALRNVLKTLRELADGRVLLAFGCGGSRDTGKRAKMGLVAAELADDTIITSDNPRKESAAVIASQIEGGFKSFRAEGCRVELDRRRAIQEIIRMARPGDIVLIAGKGHETYQEFEDTVVPFDDRIYAAESLENLGWSVRANGRAA